MAVRMTSIGFASFGADFRKSTTRSRQFPLAAQRLDETLQLLAVRQLPMPEQIDDFLIGNFADQLVDIVPAIDELALVAEHVAQRGGIRDNAFESV